MATDIFGNLKQNAETLWKSMDFDTRLKDMERRMREAEQYLKDIDAAQLRLKQQTEYNIQALNTQFQQKKAEIDNYARQVNAEITAVRNEVTAIAARAQQAQQLAETANSQVQDTYARITQAARKINDNIDYAEAVFNYNVAYAYNKFVDAFNKAIYAIATIKSNIEALVNRVSSMANQIANIIDNPGHTNDLVGEYARLDNYTNEMQSCYWGSVLVQPFKFAVNTYYAVRSCKQISDHLKDIVSIIRYEFTQISNDWNQSKPTSVPGQLSFTSVPPQPTKPAPLN